MHEGLLPRRRWHGRSKGSALHIGAMSAELEGFIGRFFDANCRQRKLHKLAYQTEVQEKIVGTIEAAGCGLGAQAITNKS